MNAYSRYLALPRSVRHIARIISIVAYTLLRLRRAAGSFRVADTDRRAGADTAAVDPALPRGQGAPSGTILGCHLEPRGDGVLGGVLSDQRGFHHNLDPGSVERCCARYARRLCARLTWLAPDAMGVRRQ